MTKTFKRKLKLCQFAWSYLSGHGSFGLHLTVVNVVWPIGLSLVDSISIFVGDETKAPWPLCVCITHHNTVHNFAPGLKMFPQSLLIRVIAETTDEEFAKLLRISIGDNIAVPATPSATAPTTITSASSVILKTKWTLTSLFISKSWFEKKPKWNRPNRSSSPIWQKIQQKF